MPSELMTEVRPVSYAEVLRERELLAEYAAECSIPEIGEPDPQREMYRAMEASGMLHTFGVYRFGALAGFASILLYVLPHYGEKIATVESLFVSDKHRCSSAGKELMEAAESCAKDAGAVVILYSAPTDSTLEKLLTLRKPYRRTNAVFCRSLR